MPTMTSSKVKPKRDAGAADLRREKKRVDGKDMVEWAK